MRRTFIIAEAGVNHNGSVEIARQLIAEAKNCGADAIKFQTFKAEKLVSVKAAKAEYQSRTTSSRESQFEMIKKLELSLGDHQALIASCKKNKILFLSSPFDEASADLLDKLDVPLFKIPSGEITNHPFLRHIGKKKKPVLLSTGMSTLGEVEKALDVIRSTGNTRITLLHCVTEYPAPYGEINLNAMLTMKNAFQVPVGYSDHTPGIEIAVAAAALGADVIEKHFTLDKNMVGPDHRASLEPAELKTMVTAIRNVEASLGDGKKIPAPCEIKNRTAARKSLVAARRIKQGERLTLNNVAVKRPGNGIAPEEMSHVMGFRARKTIEKDDVLTWELLK